MDTVVSPEGELPAPVGAGVYNVYTGEPAGSVVPTTAQLGLEPPASVPNAAAG